eukprot:2047666-Rhodomonas_salina.2
MFPRTVGRARCPTWIPLTWLPSMTLPSSVTCAHSPTIAPQPLVSSTLLCASRVLDSPPERGARARGQRQTKNRKREKSGLRERETRGIRARCCEEERAYARIAGAFKDAVRDLSPGVAADLVPGHAGGQQQQPAPTHITDAQHTQSPPAFKVRSTTTPGRNKNIRLRGKGLEEKRDTHLDREGGTDAEHAALDDRRCVVCDANAAANKSAPSQSLFSGLWVLGRRFRRKERREGGRREEGSSQTEERWREKRDVCEEGCMCVCV